MSSVQDVSTDPLATLGFDSTWSGEYATSYVSIAKANQFIRSSVIDNSVWLKATPQQQQAALVEATRDIDSLQYIGVRFTTGQRLEFPRILGTRMFTARYAIYPSSTSIQQVRMRYDIERACCLQAVWLLRLGGRDRALEEQSRGIRARSVTTGPVHEQYTYSRGTTRICYEATLLLSQWSTSRRIVRS